MKKSLLRALVGAVVLTVVVATTTVGSARAAYFTGETFPQYFNRITSVLMDGSNGIYTLPTDQVGFELIDKTSDSAVASFSSAWKHAVDLTLAAQPHWREWGFSESLILTWTEFGIPSVQNAMTVAGGVVVRHYVDIVVNGDGSLTVTPRNPGNVVVVSAALVGGEPSVTIQVTDSVSGKVYEYTLQKPPNETKPYVPPPTAKRSLVRATVADKVYTGSQIRSGFTITIGGKRLYEGVDFATSTLGANTAIGKGSVTIVGKGDYSGTKVLGFKIVPKQNSVKSAKAGKKSVKVSYKKVSSGQKVSSYQVQYQIKGTSSWKTVTVSASKSSVKLTKLKKGKVYQVRVRSLKAVSGVNYYSAWSGSKYSKKVK